MNKEQNKSGHLIDEASKTPRTQAAIRTYGDYIRSEDAVSIEFAEQLETELSEARAEIDRLSMLNILGVTDRFYPAKCGRCGWVGSSQYCIFDRSGCADDGEVLCPVCYHHISDNEPIIQDLKDYLNRSVVEMVGCKDKLIERMREALEKIAEIGRQKGDARPQDAVSCFVIAEAAIAAAKGEV